MDRNDYLVQQFISLRREIEGQQWRLFLIVMIGLLGIPALSYFLLESSTRMGPILPFFVLVLIVAYLAQQNQMMRAGRYIREHLEKQANASPGWEEWLESRPEFRLMDRHFSACFNLIFFLYYFLSIGVALNRLVDDAGADPSEKAWIWVYGAIGVYTVTTIWAIATIIHHWKSSTGTTAPLNT